MKDTLTPEATFSCWKMISDHRVASFESFLPFSWTVMVALFLDPAEESCSWKLFTALTSSQLGWPHTYTSYTWTWTRFCTCSCGLWSAFPVTEILCSPSFCVELDQDFALWDLWDLFLLHHLDFLSVGWGLSPAGPVSIFIRGGKRWEWPDLKALLLLLRWTLKLGGEGSGFLDILFCNLCIWTASVWINLICYIMSLFMILDAQLLITSGV